MHGPRNTTKKLVNIIIIISSEVVYSNRCLKYMKFLLSSFQKQYGSFEKKNSLSFGFKPFELHMWLCVE
jgi:hypothetical protein